MDKASRLSCQKNQTMKKLFFTISLILSLGFISQTLNAQFSPVDQLYYKYKGEEGVFSLRLPGFLIKLAARIGDLDPSERQLVRSIRSLSVMTIEDQQLYKHVNFTDEIRRERMKKNYRILMEVHDGSDDVIIAAREHRGQIRDLLIIVGGQENVLVHIRGRMDEDLLGSLAGVAGINQIEGISHTREI